MKATIYTTGGMMGNVIRIEAKLIEHGRRKFAQYDAAPFATFVPKGKRNARQIQASYKPFLLILEGHGHPEPDSMLGDESTAQGGAIVVSRSRYSSFDGGWTRDFNASIGAYLASNPGVNVVADYRSENSQ